MTGTQDMALVPISYKDMIEEIASKINAKNNTMPTPIQYLKETAQDGVVSLVDIAFVLNREGYAVLSGTSKVKSIMRKLEALKKITALNPKANQYSLNAVITLIENGEFGKPKIRKQPTI